MLRSAGDATGAATALTNATTNVGIAGGALLGSVLLGAGSLPALGWVGAGLVAVSLAVYATRLRSGRRAAG
jgi:predicted MFS family arabinose efflux permease